MQFQDRQATMERAIRDDEMAYQDRESRSDLIRWQQEFNEELINTVNEWLGLEKQNGEWISVSKPICNIEFIKEVVIPTCRPFLSKNMINTRFDEDTIHITLTRTMNTLSDTMADNFDKYNIEFSNYDVIERAICNLCKAGAFRALKGFTKEVDSSMIKKIETSQQQYQENSQKKGLWGAYN